MDSHFHGNDKRKETREKTCHLDGVKYERREISEKKNIREFVVKTATNTRISI